MRRRWTGFTLIELLVVIAVIVILVSISLPAINSARESAARAQCGANLRQIGVAINAYDTTNRRFPPAYTLQPQRHSIISYILPQLDQQAIADAYRFNVDWSNTANRTAARTDLPFLHCPSTPRRASTAANSDYAACVLIRKTVHDRLVSASAISPRTSLEGVLQTGLVTRAHMRDGLSHSFLFFEDCGRPIRYEKGGVQRAGTITGARWADVESYFHVHNTCGDSMMNCTNGNEIFSFHKGGCTFVYGDASVGFRSETMDPEIFVSLFTRAAGDIATAE